MNRGHEQHEQGEGVKNIDPKEDGGSNEIQSVKLGGALHIS